MWFCYLLHYPHKYTPPEGEEDVLQTGIKRCTNVSTLSAQRAANQQGGQGGGSLQKLLSLFRLVLLILMGAVGGLLVVVVVVVGHSILSSTFLCTEMIGF
eukprot:GHVS01036379.1.p1 GENE.GHVS01036379.1~~GHVS01036379.1.p1  ORF type:complete len:100 (+),score=23.41 GHVS01036379.1:127-426(+)